MSLFTDLQMRKIRTIYLFFIVRDCAKTTHTSARFAAVKYMKSDSIEENTEILAKFYTRSKLQCFNACSSHQTYNSVSLEWDITYKNLSCQLIDQDCSAEKLVSNSSNHIWIKSTCKSKTPTTSTDVSEETTTDLAARSGTVEDSVTVETSNKGNLFFLATNMSANAKKI